MNGDVRRTLPPLERVLIACLALVALCAGATPAAAQVQPYRTDDFGGFRDVLPPGTNGRSNLVELAASRPPAPGRRTTTTSATCTRGCAHRRDRDGDGR